MDEFNLFYLRVDVREPWGKVILHLSSSYSERLQDFLDFRVNGGVPRMAIYIAPLGISNSPRDAMQTKLNLAYWMVEEIAR